MTLTSTSPDKLRSRRPGKKRFVASPSPWLNTLRMVVYRGSDTPFKKKKMPVL